MTGRHQAWKLKIDDEGRATFRVKRNLHQLFSSGVAEDGDFVEVNLGYGNTFYRLRTDSAGNLMLGVRKDIYARLHPPAGGPGAEAAGDDFLEFDLGTPDDREFQLEDCTCPDEDCVC